MTLPGWNSLGSATSIHDGAEIAGIAFLALLVIAEICRFVYGHRITQLEIAAAQRRLTPEQQQTLLIALSPFQGQKAMIFSVMGDGEGKIFAEDFVKVLVKAHWDLGNPPGVSQAFFSVDPIGIIVATNETEADESRAPPAFLTLVNTLWNLHLIKDRMCCKDAHTPIGQIDIRIGRNP